jgi:hypothetical protein
MSPPVVEQAAPRAIEPSRKQTAPIANPGKVASPSGDLLSLLTGAGMNIAVASTVLRKLQSKGIETIDDAIKGDLDLFMIGSIVGVWKVLTVKAFRAGGWLPPNERRALEAANKNIRPIASGRNKSFLDALRAIPERDNNGNF